MNNGFHYFKFFQIVFKNLKQNKNENTHTHIYIYDLMPRGDHQNETEGLENKNEIDLN